MRRLVGPFAAGLVLVLLLLSAVPAVAQIPPEQRNRVTLTYAPITGGSSIGVGLTYALAPSWDFGLSYATGSVGTTSLSGFGVGARYHFPMNSPGNTFYAGGGFASLTLSDPSIGTVTASGFGVLVGGELALSERISALGELTFLGGGTVYSIGARFKASEQVGLVLAYSAVSGFPGGISFGVSFGFPSR